LIIAEDVEGRSSGHVGRNKLRGTLNACAIKAPGSVTTQAMLEDCILTGGKILAKTSASSWECPDPGLGRAKKV